MKMKCGKPSYLSQCVPIWIISLLIWKYNNRPWKKNDEQLSGTKGIHYGQPHVIKKVNEKIIAKHETIWNVQFQKLKKN
jgi:hypothetical protein